MNGCCFGSKHLQAVVVPPGGVFRYKCELTIKCPGPFEIDIDIHLADNKGIRSVTVSVKGTGIDTPENQS